VVATNLLKFLWCLYFIHYDIDVENERSPSPIVKIDCYG